MARADPPQKIGKYEILGVAGRGAMGIVYRAHDPFLDRDVAIKTTSALAGDGHAQLMARKMLFNEARAARKLDHEAILRLLDAGEHEGEPYVVMEYVPDAVTLREHCRPERLLPIERTLEIVHVCAQALDYAHRRGVIHRDIKAGNVMLTPGGRVKIGDFGIAKLDTAETTEILGAVGSPRYMSPEQVMEKPLTPQTDLYSLGVVMFELLTGRNLFEGRSFAELARRIVSESPPAVTAHRDGVPPGIDAVVAKALRKQPEERHASGLELASDLAAIQTRLAHPADGPGSVDRYRVARGLAFFNDFSDGELRDVVDACQWQRFAAGEPIIHEGRDENAFYVLAAGSVTVGKGGTALGTLATGNCFGEMGFLSRTTRSASVHARDDVVVIMATAELLAGLPTTVQLRFNQAFVHTLVDRLARTTERLWQSLT